MSSTEHDPGSGDSINRRIEAIGDQFLSDLRSGKRPDWRKIAAENPDLSPALEERLKLLETVYRAGKFLSQTSVPSTLQDPEDTLAVGDDPASRNNPQLPSGTAEQRDFNASPIVPQRAQRIRCPHCGNPVQLVDPEVTEITCVSCGSAVDVDPDATQSDATAEIPSVINRFHIKRLLGRGGFGVVYLAHDPRLDREVAIKIPRQGYFVTRDEERRFFREAKAAARLSHERIVQIHEVSVFGEAPFIVSEFIDGMTLSDLASGNPLSFREIATLLVQVCQAVEFAHQHKVIHRDLKPSNILVDHERQPHVADFGLARWDNAEMTMTMDGAILGTPAYMSPEQAAGNHAEIDARSDVYSLGVILYRLLSQELPFTGSRRMMLYQVLHDDPASPSFFNREIPRDLETITLKAMAKAKADRYASAQELCDELQRWLDQKPIRARPISRLAKTHRWCRRNPAQAALIATVTSFLIAAALFFWIKAMSETRLRWIADENAQQAIENQQQSDRRLYQIYEQNGINWQEKNRLVDAAYWFGKAIEVDDQPRHRLRLGLVADQMPKLLQLFETENAPVSAIEFSRSGERLAIRTRDQVRVFNTATGRQLFQRHNPDPGPHLVFLKQGELIAFGTGSNRVEIWDLQSKSLKYEFEAAKPISCLIADAADSQLAIGTMDCNVQFWSVAGEQVAALENTNQLFTKFQYLGDGSRLLTQSIDVERQLSLVRIYDSQSKEIVFEFEFPGQLMTDTSADGMRLATVSQGRTIQCFNLATGKPIGPEVDTGSQIGELFFDASGNRLHLLTDSAELCQRDVDTGQLVGRSIPIDALSNRLTITNDRQLISSKETQEEDVFYLLDRGIEVASRLGNKLVSRAKQFHPNGRLIAIEYDDGWVRLWDLAGALPEYIDLPHQDEVRDAQFLPGTSRCVTISRDQQASLWSIETGRRIANLDHDAAVLELDISPDGKRIATGAGNQVLLWDGLTGIPVGPPLPHPSLIRAIEFAPDGQKLLAGCMDGTIRCWEISQTNMDDPQPVFEVKHPDQILSLAMDPSGQQFASTCFEGTLNVFDLRNGRLITGPHRHDWPCSDCQFLDSERVAVACSQEIQIWNVPLGSMMATVSARENIQKLLVSNSDRDQWMMATDLSGAATIWDIDGREFKFRTQYRNPALPNGTYSDLTSDRELAAIAGGLLSATDSGRRGGIGLFDPHSGNPLGPTLKHEGLVQRVYFHDNHPQRLLISASEDGTARLWPLQPIKMEAGDLMAWLNLHGEFDDPILTPPTTDSFRELAEQFPTYLQSNENEIRHWNQLVEADQ